MLDEMDIDLLKNFAIALAMGALVGVERERGSGLHRFGGIRTFTLLALTGALSVWLSIRLEAPLVLGLGVISVGALLTASYVEAARRGSELPGITTEVAGVVVFLLGGVCAAGMPELAVPLAILTTGVLAFKTQLHTLVRRLGHDDIAAALQLLFATFIILPLLPNQTLDPWDSLNPYKLWWLVILISGLSLLGYVAVRWLGPGRGLVLTGLFGGLVSSTAVSMSFARRSREAPELQSALASGILLAWTIMFVRVVLEVAVVSPALVPAVAPSMVSMGLAAGIGVAVLYRQGRKTEQTAEQADDLSLKNPFSLWEAMKFGAFFAAILFVVALIRVRLSAQWLYAIAAVAGTTDVDAITLSLADATNRDLSPQIATWSILIAALSNTLVKLGIVATTGSRGLAKRLALATLGVIAAGVAARSGQLLLP
jgi:uncharacterized membrane protein (DUF4010 family)